MATYYKYTKAALEQQGNNIQNIAFELMAYCITGGTRLIIEQAEKEGQKYLMVDFDTTDHTNWEFYGDTTLLCVVTSVDGDNDGDIFENFNNYQDALRWLSDFLRGGDYHVIYTESY